MPLKHLFIFSSTHINSAIAVYAFDSVALKCAMNGGEFG